MIACTCCSDSIPSLSKLGLAEYIKGLECCPEKHTTPAWQMIVLDSRFVPGVVGCVLAPAPSQSAGLHEDD